MKSRTLPTSLKTSLKTVSNLGIQIQNEKMFLFLFDIKKKFTCIKYLSFESGFTLDHARSCRANLGNFNPFHPIIAVARITILSLHISWLIQGPNGLAWKWNRDSQYSQFKYTISHDNYRNKLKLFKSQIICHKFTEWVRSKRILF